MQLDRIRIRPRLRNGWEAIDLGFRVASTWYLPLFLCWLLPALLFTLLLYLVIDDSQWPLWLVWWLKPVWDRGPLYIASRKLFDDSPGLRE